jgi:hypothetical protein
MNIIVTTPQQNRIQAAQEAQSCIEQGGGYYFRKFPRGFPRRLDVGDRCYYVQDHFIRGFAIVDSLEYVENQVCETSGQGYGSGYFAYMDAKTWQWVTPSLYKGFQGFRYTESWIDQMVIVGGWLDPMPQTGLEKKLLSKKV